MQNNPLRNETKTQLQDFYGVDIFRCPQIGCTRSTKPFATAPERDAHVRCHSRPFKCSDSGREYSQLGFASARALSKHKAVHSTVESTITSIERLNLVEQSMRPVTIPQTQTNWNILSDAVVSDNIELVKDIIENCVHYLDMSWPKTKAITGKQIYDVYHSAADNCYVLVCGANNPGSWNPHDGPGSWHRHENPLLRMAINSGSIDTLRWLLDNGFGSDTKFLENEDTQTNSMTVRMSYDSHDTAVTALKIALKLAVEAVVDSNLEAVGLLLQHGAQIIVLTFCAAVRSNNPELIKMLLGHGADCYITEGLLEAVTVSDDVTRLLLDCGADINASGVKAGDRATALGWAARMIRPTTLRLLLDRGADPKEDLNRQALPKACKLGFHYQEEDILLCINILLEGGIDINMENGLPLRIVAGQGILSVVKLLLDKGADPNRFAAGKGSALTDALRGGGRSHALCAKLLLESGADPSRADKGKPPGSYVLARRFSRYTGVSWAKVVKANKDKVPGYVRE